MENVKNKSKSKKSNKRMRMTYWERCHNYQIQLQLHEQSGGGYRIIRKEMDDTEE